MQTSIAEALLKQPDVLDSEGIFRACVHCGFCNATCPTYQLSGSELEGPRGRVYLMKSVLEERFALNEEVVATLDHCLACFSCETTCPSGVHYAHLIDPMRVRIEETWRRPLWDRMRRRMLAWILPYPRRFRWALRLARLAKPMAFVLPRRLRAPLDAAPKRIPPASRLRDWEVHAAKGARKARVALLTGCAQEVLGSHINEATVRLLTRLGCEVVLPKGVGCCGALVFHMGNRGGSIPHMKNNIDHWHAELVAGGLDYVVINTSGCGTVVKDYGHIFREDSEYRDKAAAVSAVVADVTEVVAALGLPEDARVPEHHSVAYHDACSLQHAQKVISQPRELLRNAGFEVREVPEGHLCCGSAGTYNLLQPGNAEHFGKQKADSIALASPDLVAAGNIGCIEQIGRYSDRPVLHTVELLDWATGGLRPAALPAKGR